jgi:hypothetical protein
VLAQEVGQHQRCSEPCDLKGLYLALRATVAFHSAGSAEDPYEPRPIVGTRERLGMCGGTPVLGLQQDGEPAEEVIAGGRLAQVGRQH